MKVVLIHRGNHAMDVWEGQESAMVCHMNSAAKLLTLALNGVEVIQRKVNLYS